MAHISPSLLLTKCMYCSTIWLQKQDGRLARLLFGKKYLTEPIKYLRACKVLGERFCWQWQWKDRTLVSEWWQEQSVEAKREQPKIQTTNPPNCETYCILHLINILSGSEFCLVLVGVLCLLFSVICYDILLFWHSCSPVTSLCLCLLWIFTPRLVLTSSIVSGSKVVSA